MYTCYVYKYMCVYIYIHAHIYTYTYNGILTQPYKSEICSNLDGPQNIILSEINQKKILYDIHYM